MDGHQNITLDSASSQSFFVNFRSCPKKVEIKCVIRSYCVGLFLSVFDHSSKENQSVFELLTNQKAGLKFDGFLL